MTRLTVDGASGPSRVEIDSSMSKTLHQGLRVLELLSDRPSGLTITEIATLVGVHRTVAHRLVRTLEAHRLCRRAAGKLIYPATGLVTLAAPVERDLRALAQPVLEDLADSVQATSHLVLQESATEVRALLVIQPRQSQIHIAFHPGQINRIDRGSAGLAMLAAGPPVDGERPEVTTARARGYAVSYGELIPYVHGVSAALAGRPSGEAVSIGVSVFELNDEDRVAGAVVSAARKLATLLG